VLADDPDLAARGFTAEELLATAAQNLGEGVEALLPPEGRFLVNVARMVRRRLANEPEGETTPSIFIFWQGDEPPREADVDEPLLRQGHKAFESHIWLLGEVATGAKGVRLDPWEDASAFEEAAVLSVDQKPALVFNPVGTILEFFPEGLAAPDSGRLVSLEESGLTLDHIFEAIESAHGRFLATPGMQPPGFKLWRNAREYRPGDTVEHRVQGILHVSLQTQYPLCDLRFEQPGATGRVDLEVYVPQGGTKQALALLELKVLKSCDSTGDPVSQSEVDNHIKDGVEQAASYSDERGFPSSAVCCFDMRKTHTGPTCFSHVLELAKQHAVHLRVWPIFNAARAYRPHFLSGAILGESPVGA
jgi:hypothetical protein